MRLRPRSEAVCAREKACKPSRVPSNQGRNGGSQEGKKATMVLGRNARLSKPAKAGWGRASLAPFFDLRVA